MLRAQGLRQKKNALVKQTLFKAAMQLFRNKGFEATSVDEIAHNAGYSRATFFNHFGTKQGVLRYYGQELQLLVEELLDQAESTTSPVELIRQILFAMVNEAKEHLEEVRIICTYSLLDPAYLTNPTSSRKRIAEILTQLVSQAQQQNLMRKDLSPRDMALHILFLYQGVVLALVATGSDQADTLLHSMWQFILRGVQGDGT